MGVMSKRCYPGIFLILLLLYSTASLAEEPGTAGVAREKEVIILPPVVPVATAEPFLQSLESYKPIYVTHTWFLGGEGRAQGYQDQELLLHFSFKHVIVYNLFFGYTHKAFWQVYDQGNSRPFREHNYNPELFLEWNDFWSVDELRSGLEHESNGEKLRYTADARPVNQSRTWNRIYLFARKAFHPLLTLGLKLWTVTDSDNPDENSFIIDNADIQQFMGSGEFYAELGPYPAVLSIMLRTGWREGTETIRVDGRLPVHILTGGEDTGIDIFAQVFAGYGDSLIDYNRRITRFSLGVAFR